jgi:hypothetical protein
MRNGKRFQHQWKKQGDILNSYLSPSSHMSKPKPTTHTGTPALCKRQIETRSITASRRCTAGPVCRERPGRMAGRAPQHRPAGPGRRGQEMGWRLGPQRHCWRVGGTRVSLSDRARPGHRKAQVSGSRMGLQMAQGSCSALRGRSRKGLRAARGSCSARLAERTGRESCGRTRFRTEREKRGRIRSRKECGRIHYHFRTALRRIRTRVFVPGRGGRRLVGHRSRSRRWQRRATVLGLVPDLDRESVVR